MNTIKAIIATLVISLAGAAYAQNAIQFTGAKATVENAIQLYWASNTNEVYEIDYADQLNTNYDGTTTWMPLYTDYPSHGTNTFIADAGNYDLTPEIVHPKLSPMRFYRVMLVEANTSPSNPLVRIVAPTNGSTLSGIITVQVSASSAELLSEVRLYIDGEQQWKSDDGTNFVINTCEWPNGNHTLFATATSQSGLEGIANGGVITYGRSVSSYESVTFNNLISSIAFSQPFFEPALGQTQQVTAAFAAGVNWTLQIQNAISNTVRTVTGSGSSMVFNWDGTGDGGASIADGVYTYLFTAQTNGLVYTTQSDGGDTNGPAPFSFMASSQLTTQYVLHSDGSMVPLSIYPPGCDTSRLTIIEASPSDVMTLSSLVSRTTQMDNSGTSADTPMYSGITPQSSGVKGSSGTFGICYKTYSTNGFSSLHPPTGWPYPLPTRVAIDGQSRTATTTDWRIRENHYIAQGFEAEMKRGDWKRAFNKEDSQWSATDVKKASLGGNSIFNTCNFGLLMGHGSYGNTGTTGTEDDSVSYTYFWLGGSDDLRLSDMDFGSAGTNGLKWMTIFACNILKAENYNSMNNAGKIPVNANLHLLQGPSTDSWAMQGFGYEYAHNLTKLGQTVVNAYNNAMRTELTGNPWVTGTVKMAVSYWPNCLNDKLSDVSNDPDTSVGLSYQQTQVYP
jgi:hypothetical protein